MKYTITFILFLIVFNYCTYARPFTITVRPQTMPRYISEDYDAKVLRMRIERLERFRWNSILRSQGIAITPDI